jgi:NAD+ diphosphatase
MVGGPKGAPYRVELLRPIGNPNLLSGSLLDRLGHMRDRTDWVEGILAEPSTRFLPTRGPLSLILKGDPPRPALLSATDLDAIGPYLDPPVLLGVHEQHHYFALLLRDTTEAPEAMEFSDVRVVASLMEPWEASLLAYARAMAIWHRNHRYCARCGSGTRIASAGHARVCVSPDCGRQHFPKVDPAIIVLVSKGDRCLLGRQSDWPEHRYSTIAGFVEPGESLEDAVRREVLEETGVRVGETSYHSSQPWPFPSSLMLGFLAQADTDDIELRDGELSEARWVSRAEIRSREVLLPPTVSIAYSLVRHWFDSEPGTSLDALGASGPPVWR